MEKKKIEVHAVTIHIYTIIITVLVIVIALVGLKYLHLKFAVEEFTHSAMIMNANQAPAGSISDYGSIVATTVVNYPQANPLLSQPVSLQSYVATLSKNLHRDIVILDPTRKILADTVAANVGNTYTYDTDKEIDQTLKDGVSRSFVETSTDYPAGVSEVTVAMKDASNHIIGAVIVSNTTVSK